MTFTARISNPGELIASLPYQLGFRPHRSLVLVCLEQRRVALIERLDLCGGELALDQAAGVLRRFAARDPGLEVILIAIEELPGQARELLDLTTGALDVIGVEVAGRVVVHDGTWRASDPRDPDGPCQQGRVPQDRDVPVVAEFVALGVSPLERRDDLEARVRGRWAQRHALGGTQDDLLRFQVDLAERSRAETALARPSAGAATRWRRKALRRWGEHLATGSDETGSLELLDDRLLADPVGSGMLIASLEDFQVRDAVIGWLCPGAMPTDLLDRAVRRIVSQELPARAQGLEEGRRLLDAMLAVTRIAPPCYAAPALTVTASLAWALGDATLARVCVDTALDEQPAYSLARLVERLLDLAIPPAKLMITS